MSLNRRNSAFAHSKTAPHLGFRRAAGGYLRTTSRLAILAGTVGVLLASAGPGTAQTAAGSTSAAVNLDAEQKAKPPLAVALNSKLLLHADGTGEQIISSRTEIFTAAAIQSQSQKTLQYVEGMQSLDIVEAYTEKPDGRRIAVDPTSILTHDAASGYDAIFTRDQKAKTIIFPNVEVGDTLVLTARGEIKIAMFPGQVEELLTFTREVPFVRSTATIVAPKNLALHVAVEGEGLQHEVAEEAETVTHTVTYQPRRWVIPEANETSPMDRDPRVVVSTFKDYAELGQAFWTAASEKARPTPAIVHLADEITRGIDDRRAQAEAIDRWVKLNIRYVAVYLGTGRWVPNDAATVLDHKYGDCKDHATLMMALLAAKGIDSEYVLINLGNVYTLPDTVSAEYFNHAILHLPEFGVYDDPTVGIASFGVMSEQTYDKPVVLASAKGARLDRTPPMNPDENVYATHTRISVAGDGTVTGEFKQTTTGTAAIYGRMTGLNAQNIGPNVAAERWLHNNGNGGRGHVEIGTPLALEPSYVLGGTFTLNQRMKMPVSGNAAWPILRGMTPQVRVGQVLLGQRVASRSVPFTCFAGRMVEEIDITVADEFPMPLAPKGRKIENKLFSYQSSYTIDGRTLTVRREFVSRVPGQVCAPEVEAQIAPELKIVDESQTGTRLRFPAPPKTVGQAEGTTSGQAARKVID